MTRECNWIENRTEALFSEDPRVRRDIDLHVAHCDACRREVEAHREVDRLLSAYVDARMEAATAPRQGRLGLGFAVAGAGGLALAVWVIVLAWSGGPGVGETLTGTAIAERGNGALELAKPSGTDIALLPGTVDAPPPPTADRDFYVVDAAGYTYTARDLAGSKIVMGVFDATGTGHEEFGQLYEAMPAVPGLRFIAVVNEDAGIPAPRGLAVMMNRGSTLFDTRPGEFAILTTDGTVLERGSLSSPELGDTVRKALDTPGPDIGTR